MHCLIGLLGVGCLVVGILGVMSRNGLLEIASIVMLFACIVLCVLDAIIAVNQGVEGGQVFNWLSIARPMRRPEDDSYYDV